MPNYSFYSHYTSMLTEKGIHETAEYAKSMGFSSVEVLESTDPNHTWAIPDIKTATEIRKILAEYGLTTSCYSVGCNIYGHPDVKSSYDTIVSLKLQAEIAAALECPYLHHTVYTPLTLEKDAPGQKEMLEDCFEGAADVAAYARKCGVMCLYEPQGMYVNGLLGFSYFFRNVRYICDNVGICADVGNMLFVDEMPDMFFAMYANDIRHVHIKDYLYKKGGENPGMYWYKTKNGNWLRDTMVGSGSIDFKRILSPLGMVGYKGAYALELDHPEPHDAGIKQAMQYLNRIVK